jgi:hypothetical protein
MDRVAIAPLTVLIASAFRWGCKDQGAPVAGKSLPEPPKEFNYPRIYERYIDTGSVLGGWEPFAGPAAAGVLNVLEGQFRKRIEVCKPDESSFGVERDETNSLMVRFSPNLADDSRSLIAIWRQLQRTGGRTEIVTRQSSKPLASEAEALAIWLFCKRRGLA